MATSYNGWPASTSRSAIGVKPFSVAGVDFPGGVKSGDVATVLGHVALQFHKRVEPLRNPGCWGYSYRQNRNAANLSCHSSGSAIDCNAPAHPNGIEASRNFSAKEIAEVHRILAEVPELADVVHWGGDWHAPNLRPDPMHFEIHGHDVAKLARVATRIKHYSPERQEAPMNHVEQARQELTEGFAHLRAGITLLRSVKGRPVVASCAVAIRAGYGTCAAAYNRLPKR